MPKLRLGATFALVAMLVPAVAAAAADPSSNFPPPISCATRALCLQQAISYLDAARARLGQPPYRLPDGFAELSSAEQVFVTTNLDRLVYGLEPIKGLTGQLDQVAALGVRSGSDPVTSAPDLLALTSNWAGGYPNILLAYGAWMYDDGPGGANLACRVATSSDCWAHRHNILFRFSGSGPLAMGAAIGTGPGGMPSSAMLLVQSSPGSNPSYAYTWSQAVAAGAGGGLSARAVSARPARRRIAIIRLRVRRHAVSFDIAAPSGLTLSCRLSRFGAGRWIRERSGRCHRAMTYRRLTGGRYRVRADARHAVATRYLVIP